VQTENDCKHTQALSFCLSYVDTKFSFFHLFPCTYKTHFSLSLVLFLANSKVSCCCLLSRSFFHKPHHSLSLTIVIQHMLFTYTLSFYGNTHTHTHTIYLFSLSLLSLSPLSIFVYLSSHTHPLNGKRLSKVYLTCSVTSIKCLISRRLISFRLFCRGH